MGQLHKRFTDVHVKGLIERYLSKEIGRKYLQEILDIRKTRFFTLVNEYRKNPHDFSIQHRRNVKIRTIPQTIEDNIIRELRVERTMIESPDIPLRHYNYSYVRDLMIEK